MSRWWKCQVGYRASNLKDHARKGVDYHSVVYFQASSRDSARRIGHKKLFKSDAPLYLARACRVKCNEEDCSAQATHKLDNGEHICTRHFELRNGLRVEISRLELVGAFAESSLPMDIVNNVWEALVNNRKAKK